jgi:hypothetical protein
MFSKVARPASSAVARQENSDVRRTTEDPGSASLTTISTGTPVSAIVGVSISSADRVYGHPKAMAATTKIRVALIRKQSLRKQFRANSLRGLMFLFLPQSPAAY